MFNGCNRRRDYHDANLEDVMNRREMAIVSAYTGILLGEFGDMHEYCEEIMGEPIFTHQFANKKFNELLKAKAKPDFLALATPKEKVPGEMISVSKEELLGILKDLNWAKHTIKDKLTFNFDEKDAVYRREQRSYGVFLTATKEIAEMLGDV